jgi:hypothetical protein
MRFSTLRPPAAISIGSYSKSLAAAVAAAACAAGCLALPGCLASPAQGAIIVEAAGTSAAGNPVAFRATLAIAGDELSIDLENVSPVVTREPADVLSSFYFDVVRGGSRPPLAYASAAGQVVEVRSRAPDLPVLYTPPVKAGGKGTVVSGLGLSDLAATKRGDFTWQFRQLDPTYDPLAGFGLGTVGNSDLSPSDFDPRIVDQNDFAIIRGDDLEPKGNLPGRLLVQERARFMFSGAKGWSESDITPRFTFGLGTTPDSTIVVVGEPVSGAAAGLVAPGLAGWLAARRRRQAARRIAAAGAAASSRSGRLACRPISRDTNTAM